MGANRFLVLKANGPGQLANESLKIRQGQVVRHPGYPVDENVLKEFDNFKEAQAFAEEQIKLYNKNVSRGITTMKSLEKNKSSDAPTSAEREASFRNAKIMTPEGLVDPKKAEAEIERLHEEIAQLKGKKVMKGLLVDSESYLDQNADVVAKRVAAAAKKGQLKKEDVEDLISAEKSGKSRSSVLSKLKDMVKSDAVFGKLFK